MVAFSSAAVYLVSSCCGDACSVAAIRPWLWLSSLAGLVRLASLTHLPARVRVQTLVQVLDAHSHSHYHSHYHCHQQCSHSQYQRFYLGRYLQIQRRDQAHRIQAPALDLQSLQALPQIALVPAGKIARSVQHFPETSCLYLHWLEKAPRMPTHHLKATAYLHTQCGNSHTSPAKTRRCLCVLADHLPATLNANHVQQPCLRQLNLGLAAQPYREQYRQQYAHLKKVH